MSLVHLCMPSARPAAEVNRVMAQWTERGYHIALQRDPGEGTGIEIDRGYVCERPYAGYPESVNYLTRRTLEAHRECQWIICAGDDTLPDPTKTADEIAAQCSVHFAQRSASLADLNAATAETYRQAATFGVMQPTGDDWSDHLGRIIERIAGSPWMGRSFCERINQGEGPQWHQYWHNWADVELQLVAQKLGVYWQRPDLTHYHDHAWRRNNGKFDPHQAGFSADYTRMKPLFETRKRMNFPGSEPL